MKNQVNFISSKLLDDHHISHGWFTRFGGVSEGLFKSLNGKKGNGDKNENVDENRKRAINALFGVSHERINGNNSRLAHIIHVFDTKIIKLDRPGNFTGYDASFTDKQDVILSQTTADCATVIIASTDRKVVSLVHGSWRTLKDEIISKTVSRLKQHTNAGLIAAIGPMICKKCYEFGSEAPDIFLARILIGD